MKTYHRARKMGKRMTEQTSKGIEVEGRNEKGAAQPLDRCAVARTGAIAQTE